MPKIGQHKSAESTKLLLIGNSGSGKTGALLSLAEAGYNIRIIDLDNGADILANLTRAKPEVADRIIYETFTDKLKAVQGKFVPVGVPTAFTKSMDLINAWKIPQRGDEPGYDLGPVTSWTPQDVLVIDSLTHLSMAAFRYVLALNARSIEKPHQSDYGQAQGLIETLLAYLYSSDVKCNVIVNSHVTFIGGEEGDTQPARGMPMALGKALSPKIASYFNTVLLAKVVGSGAAVKRKIITQPDGIIDLKSAAPTTMPRELPLETGLAEVFKVLRGAATQPAAKAS